MSLSLTLSTLLSLAAVLALVDQPGAFAAPNVVPAPQVRSTFYYLGQYQATADPIDASEPLQWAPAVTVSQWIDLRSIGQQAFTPISIDQVQCCLLAVSDTLILDAGWTELGVSIDSPLLVTPRSLELTLGLTPDTLTAATVGELAFELLVEDADPVNGRNPVAPNKNLVYTALLGGERLFNVNISDTAAGWENTRKRIELDYDRIRTRSQADGDELYLKYLAVQAAKYRVDYTEFLGLNPDEGTRNPSTVISDNFNRADEELNAGPWTENQDWDVVSNAAVSTSCTGSGCLANHTSSLSTDDMFVQVDLNYPDTGGNKVTGLTFRYQDTSNFYLCGVQDAATDTLGIWKFVSGAPTLIASTTENGSQGDTFKCEVDGSALEMWKNGVSKVTGTDTALTGQLQAGMFTNNTGTGDGWDNWSAEDLGAGPVLRRLLIVD